MTRFTLFVRLDAKPGRGAAVAEPRGRGAATRVARAATGPGVPPTTAQTAPLAATSPR